MYLFFIFIFQRDVIAESEDILKLGLLFGEDTNATTEELPAVLSFQHKLLQEYLAALYIVQKAKLDTAETFLSESFPTLASIENHKEVVKFTCGILGGIHASPIINHIAKLLVHNVHDKLNEGGAWPDLSILESCQKEGGLSAAEVLSNSSLAYITDINSDDTLQLNPSTCDIILDLKEVDSERFDRLWQALKSVNANVIALHLETVRSTSVTKLHYFPQLKYLHIESCDCSEETEEDLAESINSWVQPQLTYCRLCFVPMTISLMRALCKCTHLMDLSIILHNLHGKLDAFMVHPPHALRKLGFFGCSLHGADVDHITGAVRAGHLTSLEELDIQQNPIGEVAVGHLLEALICIRPHTHLRLWLDDTGVDKNGMATCLSKQFKTEWKTKLANTKLDVNF